MNAKNKKILILGNSNLVVFKFRKELIQRLLAEGYEVTVAFPNGPFGDGETSAKKYGCNFIEINIDRRGTNPLYDMGLFLNLCKIIAKLRPKYVLAYTVKPDVYGGIVCALLGIPILINITGLGKGLTEKGIVQKITVILYKLAVKNAACVFFQNENDRKFFDDHGIRYKRGEQLPGSGVNLKEFHPMEYPKQDKTVFTYIGRVMKAKGIEEYLEAARHFADRKDVEMHICGFCEENYIDIMNEYQAKGLIVYHGLVENVIDYVKNSHCIVLPSFHPEGVSNVLLEAAACARPLITTDHPGCRETVDQGKSGYLVKIKSGEDLINKMEQFIALSPEEKIAMGRAGRAKIEKEFDREIVVRAYMNIIKQ